MAEDRDPQASQQDRKQEDAPESTSDWLSQLGSIVAWAWDEILPESISDRRSPKCYFGKEVRG